MEDLTINDVVRVPGAALDVKAVRSSGPGGQNVNKVSSKVQLHVDPAAILGLDEGQRARLRAKVSLLLDAEGHVLITSQAHRDRLANLEAALDRLRTLIVSALVAPRRRRPTRPSRGAVERRLSDTGGRVGVHAREAEGPREARGLSGT